MSKVIDTEKAYIEFLDELDWGTILGDRSKGQVLREVDPTAFDVGHADFTSMQLFMCWWCEEYFDNETDLEDYDGHLLCEECVEERM